MLRFVLLIFAVNIIYSQNDNNNSNEFLLNLNENLRKEIQEIRKEMSDNSEKGRKEIEEKLIDINQGINTFQISSKEDIEEDNYSLFNTAI